MGAYNPPAPAVVPVENGMWYVTVGNQIYMAVRMNDDSLRIVTYDGQCPLGVVNSGAAEWSIRASRGAYEQQPAVLPFSFVNTNPSAPAGYETIEAELVCDTYNWSEEDQLADWTAYFYVGGVKLYNSSIASGDEFFDLLLD